MYSVVKLFGEGGGGGYLVERGYIHMNGVHMYPGWGGYPRGGGDLLTYGS